MSLNDVFTSALTVILRDGVCQNLSFQCRSVYMLKCVYAGIFCHKMGLN